jgi:predicted kinase
MSGIFQKQLSKSYLDMYDGVDTSQTTFKENFGAGVRRAVHMSNTSSKTRSLQNAWEPIIEDINKKAGTDFKNPTQKLYRGVYGTYLAPSDTRIEYNAEVNKILDFVKNNEEMLGPEMATLTHDWIIDRAIKTALHESEQYEDIAERSADWTNMPARFLGEMVGTLDDPVMQDVMMGTMGLGFFANGAASIGSIMLREAMIGAGTEVFIQKEVADWYKELGLPYTVEDFAYNVAAAGALSAAFPLAFKVGGDTVKLTLNQAKKGYNAIKSASERLGLRVSADARAAESIMEEVEATIGTSPINDVDEHLQRVDAHADAIDNGEAPTVTNEPASGPKAAELENVANPGAKPRATINDVVSRFEVDELNVDAKAFQFKEGGDEFGVTERLKDVKTWDPVKAGTVVVYEQADGKLFIADGHQRLGLAKRIKSQDPKQDVFLLGSVLREKDGISRDQAMVVAAMKNIAEGTGTVLDAVKVLKGDQKLFKELPPRSALVRMARNIVNINDDEAFGLFKNGLVSPQQAAVVGRMIPEDATMQRAAMNVLAKAKPENDVQAESIVRQVMDSGTEKVNQESLFGNALEEESLYFERAKVLDNAVKILQRDKSAFNTIVKNQTKFESEGNQLARSANEQKIQKDGQAIQLIQTLANRRGQLSDDLTAAARVAKQSGQYNKATDSFVQSVRGAVDRGDFNGEILSDPGLAIDAPPQNGTIPTRAVEKSLDDFDDPAGLGSQKQMDQMEADMFQQPPEVKPREAFQSDDELRNDLGNIIEQGADETVVDAHPAVTKAIEESMARPETTTLPGYGTDQFRQTRSFNTLSLQKLGVKLENTITGYTDAIVALYKGARNLAWKDDGLDLPVGKYINQDKRAAIVLGPPAAGKSTLANPIARRMNAAIIDSDEAKKILPEYDGGIGANAVHEESSALAERVLNMALELGDNVVIPKVGGTVGSIEKLVNKLKEKGYSVDLVDMSVTYKNARNRMFLRFVKTGRLINPDYVRQVGDNPGKTYDTLKQQGKADGYTRIDNNGQIDKPKDLIEDTSGLTQGSDIRLRRSGGERDPGGELAGSQERGFRGAEEITDGELDLEIPVGQRIDDATNEVTVVNQTMRQIKDEIDYENKMIDRMGYCVK